MHSKLIKRQNNQLLGHSNYRKQESGIVHNPHISLDRFNFMGQGHDGSGTKFSHFQGIKLHINFWYAIVHSHTGHPGTLGNKLRKWFFT